MKRPFLKIATHATALLVGALLAPALVRAIESLHPPAGSTAVDGSSTGSPSPADEAALHTPATSRSEAFRQAWHELSLRPATREERLDHQRKLLKLWAEFDLEGALRAAVAEGGSMWFEGNNAAQLIEVFSPCFRAHPEEAWRVISKASFGIDQTQLEQRWLERLYDRPEIIISHLSEIFHYTAATEIYTLQTGGDPPPPPGAIRAALLKSGVSESVLADVLVDKQSLQPGDSVDWAAQPAGPERTAARADWVAHLATLDPAAYAAAWESVPAADRAEVARLTVRMLHDSPLLLPALDHLIATGQWDVLGSDVISSALQTRQRAADPFAPDAGGSADLTAKGPDHAALIAWASDLPDRPEAIRFLEMLQPPADPFATAGGGTPDGSIPSLDDFPPGTWQHEEILLQQIARTASSGSPGLQDLVSRITSPARQQQAREILRRAALLKAMR